MTLLFLTAGVQLAPMLADLDWTEIIKQGGLAAVVLLAGLVLKLIVSGVLRLEREVKAAEARAAEEREGRLVAEEKLARLHDTMSADFSPALLRNSITGEKMVEAVEKIAALVEKLIDAFLRRIER